MLAKEMEGLDKVISDEKIKLFLTNQRFLRY